MIESKLERRVFLANSSRSQYANEGSQRQDTIRNCDEILLAGLLFVSCLSDFLLQPRLTFIRTLLPQNLGFFTSVSIQDNFSQTWSQVTDMREKSFRWGSLLCLLHIISAHAYLLPDMLSFPPLILRDDLLIAFISQCKHCGFCLFCFAFIKNPFRTCLFGFHQRWTVSFNILMELFIYSVCNFTAKFA